MVTIETDTLQTGDGYKDNRTVSLFFVVRYVVYFSIFLYIPVYRFTLFLMNCFIIKKKRVTIFGVWISL